MLSWRRPRPPPARIQGDRPVEELPPVAAWRDAYRAFGAKPQRTRNSLESLLRRVKERAASGEPAHRYLQRSLGGSSDSNRGRGSDPLQRPAAADACNRSGTVRHHRQWRAVIEHPEAGEVVWRDDVGVTCRRWNWRQATRTQLRNDTTAALFILDALDPITDEALKQPPMTCLSTCPCVDPTFELSAD